MGEHAPKRPADQEGHGSGEGQEEEDRAGGEAVTHGFVFLVRSVVGCLERREYTGADP